MSNFLNTLGEGTWGTADDDYGDLRLTNLSPARDSGDNSALPAGLTTDLAGQPRIVNGTVDMGAYELQLSQILTAAFSASPTSGPLPLTVTFTDQSSGNPTGWRWDFGDGGSSTEQHPSHTYFLAGSFSVTLTVSNAFDTHSAGGTDDSGQPLRITVTEPLYFPIIMKNHG